MDGDGLLRVRHGAVRPYVYRTLPRGVRLDMHYALGLAALLGAYADGVDRLAQARRIDCDGRRDSLDMAPERVARSISLDIEYADALQLAGDPLDLTELVAATEAALDIRDESLVAAAGFAPLQLGGASPAGEPDDTIAALADRVLAAITDPELRAPVQAAASRAWSMTGHCDTARALFDEAESAATRTITRLAVLPLAYVALGRPQDLPDGRRSRTS